MTLTHIANRVLIVFLLWRQVFVGCQPHKDKDKVETIAYLVKEYANVQFKIDRLVRKGIDTSSESHMTMFSRPLSASLQQYKCAFIETQATRELQRMTGLNILSLLKMNKWKTAWENIIQLECSSQRNISCNDSCGMYRTFDGSFNNEHYPTWGMASRAQKRYLPPVYSDGIDAPRTGGVESSGLPSARLVSNVVFKAKSKPTLDAELTVLHMAFGQFITNDVLNTPVITGENGETIECCNSTYKRPECIPIDIPESDPDFSYRCMNLVRSVPSADDNCFNGYRDQINVVTSFLDASTVYGSSEEKANSIRTFKGGLLKLGVGNGLPEGDNKCFKDVPSDYCQDAGDGRVNVVPNLSTMHLLFHLEHNRIAHRLQEINSKWDDETVFQESRRIVIALIQNIVYNEYLPPVVGRKHMDEYKLTIMPNYIGNIYDDQLDPTISNVFATGAFRFGHSQIPNTQKQLDKNHEVVNTTNIEGTFHRPHFVEMNMGYGYSGVMRWMALSLTPEVDREFENGIRNKLFPTNDGRTLDLPAINIQRGRDHGIAPYNKWREWCGLSPAKSFFCKTSGLVDHDQDAVRALASVYKSPEDIDLFAGAISERHLEGASVGPTFACIISKQFHDLKFGDRFWYENEKTDHSFEPDQLNKIKNITLANIICKNFDMHRIRRYAFKQQGVGNDLMSCETLLDLDLSLWKSENWAG